MNDLIKEWYRQRVEAIHNVVTAYDVLRQNGIDISQAADDRAEQISCPFHGADKKPSARVYPDEGDSKSHVWCYVCQEPGWDAIGLWRKFNNDMAFGPALKSIETAYGLDTPDPPKEIKTVEVTKEDEDLERFKKYYIACEDRLKGRKTVYKNLGDMTGYLTAGAVLDKVFFRVKWKKMTTDRAITVLQQLLDKIREREEGSLGGL